MLRSDIHVNYSSALQILPVSSCLANIPLCKVSTKTCANPTVGAANRDVRRIRVKQAGSGWQSVGAGRGRDRGALGEHWGFSITFATHSDSARMARGCSRRFRRAP